MDKSVTWEKNGDKTDVTYPEESVIKVKHLRAHKVLGTNSAKNDNVSPNSLITKDTNTTVCVQTSKGLGNLYVAVSLYLRLLA